MDKMVFIRTKDLGTLEKGKIQMTRQELEKITAQRELDVMIENRQEEKSVDSVKTF